MAKKNTSAKANKKNNDNNKVILDFTETYAEINEMVNTPVIDVEIYTVSDENEPKLSLIQRFKNWLKKR